MCTATLVVGSLLPLPVLEGEGGRSGLWSGATNTLCSNSNYVLIKKVGQMIDHRMLFDYCCGGHGKMLPAATLLLVFSHDRLRYFLKIHKSINQRAYLQIIVIQLPVNKNSCKMWIHGCSLEPWISFKVHLQGIWFKSETCFCITRNKWSLCPKTSRVDCWGFRRLFLSY